MMLKKRTCACLIAVAIILMAILPGCNTDPVFEGFAMKPSELILKLNEEMAGKIVLPEFAPDKELKSEGNYSKAFSSKTDELTISLLSKKGEDSIRIITNDVDLKDFTLVSSALIDVLEPTDKATEVKLNVLIGKAESDKYIYTSGASVPNDENGLSNLLNSKWVLLVVPKAAEEL